MDEQLRAYGASGLLHYGDGSSINCGAIVTQDHDGALGLRYEAVQPGQGPPVQWLHDQFDIVHPIRFEGQTPEGLPIAITGTFRPGRGHWNAEAGASREFRVITMKDGARATLEVGTRSDHGGGDWHFGIANLTFYAPDATTRPDGSIDHGGLILQLGSQAVRLERRADYGEADEDLNSRNVIRITAEACVPASMTFGDAQEFISDLCALLSIANRTLITWVYCDQVTTAGERQYSFHFPAKTGQYNGGLPLISPNMSADLPRFVELTFEPFRTKKEDWSLLAFSRAYSDLRSTGFLDTRCLQAGCLIDFLTGIDAAVADDATVLPESEFSARLPRLCSALQKILLLAFPALTNESANGMAQHARFMNYRTFQQKIERTSRRLRVVLRSDDIKPVIETRNSLVHRMRFQTVGNEWVEFARTLSVLDRLLMGLLEYQGPYIDPLTLTRVDSSRNSE
jgi:hypothetical protein